MKNLLDSFTSVLLTLAVMTCNCTSLVLGDEGSPIVCNDEGLVFSVSVSPNGQHVVTGDSTGRISFRSLDSAAVQCSHNLHHGRVNSIAFSPDGDFLATTGEDGKVVIFDVVEKEIRTIINADKSQGFARFSPDGKSVATATDLYFTYGDIKLWNVSTGELIHRFERRTVAHDAIFVDDGKKLLATFSDSLEYFDASTGKRIRRVKVISPHPASYFPEEIFGLRLSPDGKKLAVLLLESAAIVDFSDLSVKCHLQGHKDHLTGACFTPDSIYLVTGALDGAVKLWHTGKGRCVSSVRLHKKGIIAMCLSPDGKHLITSDESAKVFFSRTDIIFDM
ncbi:WD40 repeat domain-containing protein [Lignipirellula cremea]|uniref:WD domain, G-beta repeat n=1 Tax=Lignipirellula cremea TaxID=2528010 RepID=A0A518DYN3_9BACT|nr:PD40 domain-containing protein [Lignipirellula cremea]QDU96911.1 WD domain, G-beta repeat [Lignipirellula cremea]